MFKLSDIARMDKATTMAGMLHNAIEETLPLALSISSLSSIPHAPIMTTTLK